MMRGEVLAATISSTLIKYLREIRTGGKSRGYARVTLEETAFNQFRVQKRGVRVRVMG